MFGRRRTDGSFMFSPEGRRALADAREEAGRFRHEYIGPFHLALALLRRQDELPASILRESGVEPDELIAAIERQQRPGTSTSRGDPLPYTSQARKVFQLASVEALARGEGLIAPVHLFMALMLMGQRGELLSSLGVDLARLRGAYDRLAGGARHAGAGSASTSARLDIRIDDSSSLSIYEQLVAQVKEAVATGARRAGERLPTVRQLADQLDIAPGTVARAYGELERLGVIVTEGARGTRVAERGRDPETVRRPETLVGLLRPVAVAAFHLGATADEMRTALERAMEGIFGRSDAA